MHAATHTNTDSHAPAVAVTLSRADDQERRILAALGLSHGPLPKVRSEWLLRYYDHLAANLSLPFEAEYAEDIAGFQQLVAPITVTAILHPERDAVHDEFGLLCRALRGQQKIEVPLADVEPRSTASNSRLIEDYWYWIWNWRFDPRI
jgi:hypothetical protein